jgi:hypothetical protein
MEKIPIRTKSAINARKRNSRTPNESPNALDRTGGAEGAGEVIALMENSGDLTWLTGGDGMLGLLARTRSQDQCFLG